MTVKLDNKGFTLIEAMLVVAIITILAAIAVPNFISYRGKSYCTAAEVEARTVAAAVAEYFAHVNRYNIPDISDLNFSGLNAGTTIILGTDAERSIIIKVTDFTHSCSLDYQRSKLREDENSTGWDGNYSYYNVIK